jgi:hypothetical protein
MVEVGGGSFTILHNLHNLASPQLHIVWTGAAMIDADRG